MSILCISDFAHIAYGDHPYQKHFLSSVKAMFTAQKISTANNHPSVFASSSCTRNSALR